MAGLHPVAWSGLLRPSMGVSICFTCIQTYIAKIHHRGRCVAWLVATKRGMQGGLIIMTYLLEETGLMSCLAD